MHKCLPLFLLFILPFVGKADSPLTSTPFFEAYRTETIVGYAMDHPVLDKKIAKFLMKPNKPLALKAAVINSMGWDPDGKNNAEILLGFLVDKRKITSEAKDFTKLTAHDLFCMGYCMAMDDYFNVEAAAEVLAKAGAKMPHSLTAQLIHALVMAQMAMDQDFCMVYTLVSQVVDNQALNRDLNAEAVRLIMDYINLYQENC